MAIANLIKVDNGYFESIFDARTTLFTAYNIEVFIWEGDLTADKPSTATLSLTVPAESVTGETYSYAAYFDLGRYIQPYLDYLPKTTNYQKGVWVQYEYTRNLVLSDPPVVSDVLYALLGANRYDVGNTSPTPQTEFNGVVMGCNSNELTCHPESDLVAPVYVGSDSTNAKIVTETQAIDLTTLGATLNSDDSNEQIFYIPLNATTFGSEWQEGKTIKYYITDSTGSAIIEGISFNGSTSYMDLGIVPMLNSDDSFVKLTFRPFYSNLTMPFGYNNTNPDIFNLVKYTGYEQYSLLSNIISVNPSDYPNINTLQEFYVYDSPASGASDPTLNLEIGGNLIGAMEDVDYVRRLESGIPFYLGARNNGGTAQNFTSCVFTKAEFYNGTEKKLFNSANNWKGATNYGGVKVYSLDGGDTWNTEGDNVEYSLRLKCFKGDAKAIRYYNCDGVIVDIPVNGRLTESANYQRKTFNNFTLNDTGGWDPSIHSKKAYQSNGRESFVVHTGWVKESVNEMVKDMLLSKAVWLVYGSNEIPVVVKDTQKKFINRLWEKEIGYTINLEASNEILL